VPEVHQILALDLLTLRDHTERAGDRLDKRMAFGSSAASTPTPRIAAHRCFGRSSVNPWHRLARGIPSLRSNVYKPHALFLAFHARLGFPVTRVNAIAVAFTACIPALQARSRLALR